MTWLPIDEIAKSGSAVWVTWAGSASEAVARPAAWRDRRIFQNDDFGPGFVCWFTGTPLTTMTHYMLPPDPPRPEEPR